MDNRPELTIKMLAADARIAKYIDHIPLPKYIKEYCASLKDEVEIYVAINKDTYDYETICYTVREIKRVFGERKMQKTALPKTLDAWSEQIGAVCEAK